VFCKSDEVGYHAVDLLARVVADCGIRGNSVSEYGFAVIDFMNVPNVLANLVSEEVKNVDTIDFNIKRYLKDGYIYKEIN
jgi:hypothetical protein